jgi:hypothetical protein
MALAPVLLVKVIVARYQKTARGLLMALGIAIFAMAFTLVALNVSTHYLRLASAHKAPRTVELSVLGIHPLPFPERLCNQREHLVGDQGSEVQILSPHQSFQSSICVSGFPFAAIG